MKKLLLGVGVGASSPLDLLNCLADETQCSQVVKIGADGGVSGSLETPHEYGRSESYMFELAVPTGMTHIEWSFDEFEIDWSDDGLCSHDQVYIFDRDANAHGPFCGFDEAFANSASLNYDYNYDRHLGNQNLGERYSATVTQDFPLRIGLITDDNVVNYGFKISYNAVFIPCESGFQLDNGECVDSNECDGEGDGNSCDAGQCVNLEGSHQCGCEAGYEVEAQACVDVDECLSGPCSGDSYCANSEGSYECICNVAGYGYSNGVCSDIDECTTGQCNVAAACENFDPGYSCVCPDGFSDPNGDGSTCLFEDYPTGWIFVPSFDAGTHLFVSDELFTSQVNAFIDAGSNNAYILLCEEFYDLPYGMWRSGNKYPCSDALQRLTAARYSNQGRSNCYFQDYKIYCNEAQAVFNGYIAKASAPGTVSWDSDVLDESYIYQSNEVGSFYDTGISSKMVTFNEAAQICSAHGGRLFNEEIDASYSGTCNNYYELHLKAHGRLYQIPKMDASISGQVFTGYRANAAGDNWCWFDGVTCHDTLPMTQTPMGGYVDAAFAWAADASNPDCSVPAIADAINAALQTEMANIGTVIQDRCVLYDFSAKQFVTAGCDSQARFICERPHWDCSNSPCSDICNPAGYCECPDDKFLTDFYTCTAIPDLTDIECGMDTMVAWFSVEEIRYGGELGLNDPTCNEASAHIQQVGNRYRVETRLDGCGTEASYDADTKMITFSNAMGNAIDMTQKINMKSRVANTFSCMYSSVVELEDTEYSREVSRSDLEKEDLGTFGFELNLWTSDTFDQAMVGNDHRVGSTLYFTVTQTPVLTNVVYRTNKCSVFNSNKEHEFVLFDAEQDKFDPFVDTMRYKPTYDDTCASEIVDRYSYTVFEFIQDQNKTIHIDCSIQVCVKEDDMSASSCNMPCDATPFNIANLG